MAVKTTYDPSMSVAKALQNVKNNSVNVNGVTVKNNNPAQTGVSNVSFHDFSPNIPSTTNNSSLTDALGKIMSAPINTLNNAANIVNDAYTNGTAGSYGTNTTTTSGGYTGVPNQNMDYMNQLSSMLQAQQAQQQAALQANQQAHQALIEQAYNNNLGNLRSAYGQQTANLGNTYNDTLGQLEKNYEYSQNQLNQNAENALREAYINRMMAEKNLEQKLNAQGLTGGAAESVIASLLNNYGSARNSIENQRLSDLADLLNVYQNNTQSARQKYTDALNDVINRNYGYERQIQDDLTKGVIGTYDDLYGALNSGYNTYANAMQGLAASQVNNAADLAAANYKNAINAANKASTTSTKSTGSTAGTGKSASGRRNQQIIDILAEELLGQAYPQYYLKTQIANGNISEEEAAEALVKAGLR
jgi:hypothetical protein